MKQIKRDLNVNTFNNTTKIKCKKSEDMFSESLVFPSADD